MHVAGGVTARAARAARFRGSCQSNSNADRTRGRRAWSGRANAAAARAGAASDLGRGTA
jgi:hypothetical protein